MGALPILMFANPGLLPIAAGYLYPGTYPMTANLIPINIPIARTFTNLLFTVRASGGGTNSVTVKIQNDGFDTSFIASGASNGSFTGSLSILAGHTIEVRVNWTGNGATAPSDVIVYLW